MLIADLKNSGPWRSEAELQGKFTRYLRTPEGDAWFSSLDCGSGAWFELKLIKHGNRLPYSCVADHQVAALRHAKHGLLSHKVSDSALGLKPADCVVVSRGGGFLVVGANEARNITIIDIDRLLAIRGEKVRGSWEWKELEEKEAVSR